MFAKLADASEEKLNAYAFVMSIIACIALMSLLRRWSKSAWSAYGLDYHDQWEWLIRAVSIFHATFVAFFAIHWLWLLLVEVDPADPLVFGVLPNSGLVCSVSLGYFTWDLVIFSYADYQIAQKWKETIETKFASAESRPFAPRRPRPIGGVTYIVHHFFASAGQLIGLYYGVYPLGLAVGLGFEATTPLLNAIWIAEKSRADNTCAYKLTGVLFLLFWLVFRLSAPAMFLMNVFAHVQLAVYELQAPLIAVGYFAIAAVFFNCLNWYWFAKIIARLFRPSKTTSKSE